VEDCSGLQVFSTMVDHPESASSGYSIIVEAISALRMSVALISWYVILLDRSDPLFPVALQSSHDTTLALLHGPTSI